jgi:hypothetical protein
MLLLGALVLFIAAIIGLFFTDSTGPRRPGLAPGGAPPVDHIDDESRDALRDILREEDGG